MTLKLRISTIVAAAGFMLSSVTIGASAQSTAPQESPAVPAEPTIPEREGVWGDIVYGSPDATVELIEYGSLTCPHCASFSSEVLPRLMVDFINDGKLRFVFRNFVRDRFDLAAAMASRCMTSVDATKRTLSTLFAEQAQWLQSANPLGSLTEIVSREGLDQEGLTACLRDQQVRVHIVAMTQNGAKKYDIKGIPTLVLNGVAMSFPGYEALKLRIEAQLGSDFLNND